MSKSTSNEITIADDAVMSRIYLVRGHKVMLDSDLAMLYGVETRVLNQAVKRNIARFPEDFKFELTESEFESLRSQIVILKTRGTHTKYLPSVFTEQGVAMLSSALRSPQAIQVNIQITRVRQMLTDNTELRLEIAEVKNAVEKINQKQTGQDKNIELIFEYIDRLQEKLDAPNPKERKKIGYVVGDKK